MTTIHLIRHGEVFNPHEILYLRLPGMYLSENGHRQAHTVASLMASRPVTAVYSSPMPRAVQTADYFRAIFKLTLHTSPLINEIHSPHEGLSMQRIAAMNWDLYSNLPGGYESWDDVLARIQQFCRATCAQHPDAEVIAVSHGDIVITATMWAAGHALTLENRGKIPYPGHVSITSLKFNTPDAHPTYTYTDPFANANSASGES